MTDIAFRMSEQIDAISAAIAKAQAELENVDKTGANPAFKADGKAAKYVKLGVVLDTVRPVFAKHGIAIVQMAVNGEGPNIGVVTMLAHAGQWIESRLYVAPMKFDAQGAGSAITYCRRYALMAMAGVAPDDDDGNDAVAQPTRLRRSTEPDPFAPPAAQQPERSATNGAGGSAAAGGTNGPTNDDPNLARCREARDRIKAAIEKAEEPIFVEEILRVNRVDLEFILGFHEKTYSFLMGMATARSNELRSAA